MNIIESLAHQIRPRGETAGPVSLHIGQVATIQSGPPATVTLWLDGQVDSSSDPVLTPGCIFTGSYVPLIGDIVLCLAEGLDTYVVGAVADPIAGGGWTTGDLKLTAATGVPVGWLACNGAAYSRTTYVALFDAIGTTWGVGDGSTTFNVPTLTAPTSTQYLIKS